MQSQDLRVLGINKVPLVNHGTVLQVQCKQYVRIQSNFQH